MSNTKLHYAGLSLLLLITVFVWMIVLVLMWFLTQLYLQALTSIVDLAQLY